MLWSLPLALDPRFRGDDGGESGDDGERETDRLYGSDTGQPDRLPVGRELVGFGPGLLHLRQLLRADQAFFDRQPLQGAQCRAEVALGIVTLAGIGGTADFLAESRRPLRGGETALLDETSSQRHGLGLPRFGETRLAVAPAELARFRAQDSSPRDRGRSDPNSPRLPARDRRRGRQRHRAAPPSPVPWRRHRAADDCRDRHG